MENNDTFRPQFVIKHDADEAPQESDYAHLSKLQGDDWRQTINVNLCKLFERFQQLVEASVDLQVQVDDNAIVCNDQFVLLDSMLERLEAIEAHLIELGAPDASEGIPERPLAYAIDGQVVIWDQRASSVIENMLKLAEVDTDIVIKAPDASEAILCDSEGITSNSKFPSVMSKAGRAQ